MQFDKGVLMRFAFESWCSLSKLGGIRSEAILPAPPASLVMRSPAGRARHEHQQHHAVAPFRSARDHSRKLTGHASEQGRLDVLKRREEWFTGQLDPRSMQICVDLDIVKIPREAKNVLFVAYHRAIVGCVWADC